MTPMATHVVLTYEPENDKSRVAKSWPDNTKIRAYEKKYLYPLKTIPGTMNNGKKQAYWNNTRTALDFIPRVEEKRNKIPISYQPCSSAPAAPPRPRAAPLPRPPNKASPHPPRVALPRLPRPRRTRYEARERHIMCRQKHGQTIPKFVRTNEGTCTAQTIPGTMNKRKTSVLV